jgi:Arginase family
VGLSRGALSAPRETHRSARVSPGRDLRLGNAVTGTAKQTAAEHTEVIGFDLVEVNPMLDVGTGVTSYLAAHTVVEFLAFICDQPG